MPNDKIQFRGAEEKQAAQFLDEFRLGGINISELARQGLREKLRETLSEEEKQAIKQQYERGEVAEEVAEILLGDRIDETTAGGGPFPDDLQGQEGW